MATKKSNSSSRSASTSKAKTANSKSVVRTVEKSETTETKTSKHIFAGFFSRKYEGKEGITTVFKDHKFYGALLGEALGSMFLTLFMLSLVMIGLFGQLGAVVHVFGFIAITVAIFAFSGACLNPIITVGMMATRRISVIRGIMYIVAEIFGAWLAWLIMNGCRLAGAESAYPLTGLTTIEEGMFWPVAAVEFIGAGIIAFFFARGLEYKRSVFTFAAVAAGGIVMAILVAYVISAAFFGLSNNYILNPAVALMMKIFPESGENFGEIFGGICQALSAYALIPAIGGVVGFYLADFTKKLTD